MNKPIRKEDLLKALEQEDMAVISLAYVYAKNMKLYGEDVTKAWVTAVQQNAILEKAYRDGYYEGVRQTASKEEKSCGTCYCYNVKKHECEKGDNFAINCMTHDYKYWISKQTAMKAGAE